MKDGTFVKNITFAEPQSLLDLVDYQEGRVEVELLPKTAL